MNNHILVDKNILTDKRLSSNDRIVYFALVALLDQYKEYYETETEKKDK